MNFSNAQILDFSIPQFDDVGLKHISKDYFKIICLNKMFFYAILFAVIFLIRSFVDEESFQNGFWYLFVLLLIFCATNLILSIMAIKKRKYAIREHDVIYAKGLLVNTLTTVPISRIQHIEASRSWLERQFNLSTLKIYTAGESGSDLCIKGLPSEEAVQINDFISAKVNGTN